MAEVIGEPFWTVADTFNRMRNGERVPVSVIDLEQLEASDDPDVLRLATIEGGDWGYIAFLTDNKTFFWVRCGDQDDYRKFGTMSEVADYLASMLCDQPLYWECDMGVSDGKYYKQNNYISIYLGGEQADIIHRGLTQDELKQLNDEMEKAHRERATS